MPAASRRSVLVLALLTLAAACARAPKAREFAPLAELVFRRPPEAGCTPDEMIDSIANIETRLRSFEPRGVFVEIDGVGGECLICAADGVGCLVVRLGFAPTEIELAAIRARVESAGRLEFLAVVDGASTEFDLDAERQRVEVWRAADPDGTAAEFSRVPRAQGGPATGLRWFVVRSQPQSWLPCDVRGRESQATSFDESDLGQMDGCYDAYGLAAIGFDIREARRPAFAAFTESLLDRQLAIIVEDEVATAPKLNAALRDSAIIGGRWSVEERDALLDVLRAGRLPFRFEFVEQRAPSK